MDLAAILEQGAGALFGGALAASISWVAVNKKVGVLEKGQQELSANVDKCQSEREFCRKSMREHHEDTTNHVGPDMRTIITDIQARLIRIETKLMNGSCMK